MAEMAEDKEPKSQRQGKLDRYSKVVASHRNMGLHESCIAQSRVEQKKWRKTKELANLELQILELEESLMHPLNPIILRQIASLPAEYEDLVQDRAKNRYSPRSMVSMRRDEAERLLAWLSKRELEARQIHSITGPNGEIYKTDDI
ncbi:hypothetical protein NDU88_002245 [Pleurodeles waltl]|uniref:Uncharacterized protein n=1 Tax=Pleurodeles waltl TaxID=8319 RepID=A0AAV7T1R9_PLEWA|nr:hypothetical protein NDU88_002245 [Pleurodeles waltl]